MKMTIFELKKLIKTIIRENSDDFSEINDSDSYKGIKKTPKWMDDYKWMDDKEPYKAPKWMDDYKWMDDKEPYKDIKKTHRLVNGKWEKMNLVKNPYEDIKKTHKWVDDEDPYEDIKKTHKWVDDDENFKNESTPKSRMNESNKKLEKFVKSIIK